MYTTGHHLTTPYMKAGRIDKADFEAIASEMGLAPDEVCNAVLSFFDAMVSEARSLPFNNPRRVYSKDVFDTYGSVYQIPSIGRLGPSFTRYKAWRANEAGNERIVGRQTFNEKLRREDIEDMARSALEGIAPDVAGMKRRRRGKYNKVWHVSSEGRRLAWQVQKKK